MRKFYLRYRWLLWIASVSLSAIQDSNAQDSGFRVWTNTEGREIVARLTTANDSQVVLFIKGGKKPTPVPLSSLSETDRQFVQSWLQKRKNDWIIHVLGPATRSTQFRHVRPKKSGEIEGVEMTTASTDGLEWGLATKNGKTTVTISPGPGEEIQVVDVRVERPASSPSSSKFLSGNFKMIVMSRTERKPGGLIRSILTKPPQSLKDEGEFKLVFIVPKGTNPVAIAYGDQPEIPL